MQEVIPAGATGAVVAWDPNSGDALPAYLADVQNELGTNIPERQTVPTLSYEGKTWQIIKDGNKTKLQVQNADGDMVPVPIMRVVVLNFNGDRGRAYYPQTYNPAASAAPVCWSADGKAPDPSVKEKQSPLCNGCPQSVKGSKIQDGKEMVACAQHRMIVVAPAFSLDSDPLRLKIAVTSDYDKELVEHGWFAFRQYTDFLKSRGITHTGLVVTKIKFDPNTAYPKLLFSLDRILTPDEIEQMKKAIANPRVGELLAEKWTAAGSAGTPIDDSDIAPQPDLQQTSPGHVAQQPDIPPPSKPKPSDASHIAHAGTEHEVWWDGEAWVKPWIAANAEGNAAPPPPPQPEIPAAEVVIEQYDPIAAAKADGWIQHPDSEPHGYKGQEVLAWSDIAARYPGNGSAGAATTAPSAPVSTPAAGSQTSAAGQTATTAASPSDAEMDPTVKALLDKWTQ